jgi:hypothetical protein
VNMEEDDRKHAEAANEVEPVVAGVVGRHGVILAGHPHAAASEAVPLLRERRGAARETLRA